MNKKKKKKASTVLNVFLYNFSIFLLISNIINIISFWSDNYSSFEWKGITVIFCFKFNNIYLNNTAQFNKYTKQHSRAGNTGLKRNVFFNNVIEVKVSLFLDIFIIKVSFTFVQYVINTENKR